MGTLVQIRDVPEAVHRTLKARAAREGRTLSDFLRRELERIAELPTPEEMRRRLEALEPVETGESSAATIRALREEIG